MLLHICVAILQLNNIVSDTWKLLIGEYVEVKVSCMCMYSAIYVLALNFISSLQTHTAVFLWQPPQDKDDDNGTLASYVIPSAQLTIASEPNGDYYDVKFEV